MTRKVARLGRRASSDALAPSIFATALACLLALVLAPAGFGATTTPKPGPPVVSTGGVHLQGATATLLGTVNPRGAVTTYYFQYGATVAYGKQTTPATLPVGTTVVRIGQTAPGILPGYHYRLVAGNSFGPVVGKDRTLSPSKTHRVAFALTKLTEPIVYGGGFSLGGRLTGAGAAGRRLVLQESPYPFLTSFATVGLPALTTATGAFSFRVPRLLLSTQYRIATLDPRPLYSPLVTVDAAYRVTLKVKRSSHKGIVRLYGTVTPAAVGAHVYFQLLKKVRPGDTEKTEERTTRFATRFATKVKRGTPTVSRFSSIVKVLKGGSYRARVVPSKEGPLVAGASSTVVLHSVSK
jgi:hypothetical protein